MEVEPFSNGNELELVNWPRSAVEDARPMKGNEGEARCRSEKALESFRCWSLRCTLRGQFLKYWKMATVAKPATVDQKSTFLIFESSYKILYLIR